MATVAQPAAAQPVFVPLAGTQIMYHPQTAGGAVIMPVISTQPPKYEYTPNDFIVFSIITVILCGILSPLSLLLSLPALMFSLLSRKNSTIGAVKVARKQGIVAAYLNVAAVVAALVVACLVLGFVVGFLGPPHARQLYCNRTGNCY